MVADLKENSKEEKGDVKLEEEEKHSTGKVFERADEGAFVVKTPWIRRGAFVIEASVTLHPSALTRE